MWKLLLKWHKCERGNVGQDGRTLWAKDGGLPLKTMDATTYWPNNEIEMHSPPLSNRMRVSYTTDPNVFRKLLKVNDYH